MIVPSLRTLLAVVSFASMASLALPATADDFSQLASFQKVDDATLTTMRGKYVPPDSAMNSVPLSNQQSSGQVTYFGIQMISSWTVQGKSGPQGVTVGSTIRVSPLTHSITISNWSSSQDGGLPNLSKDGNNVNGSSPTNNFSGGIGQSIQVAGDDNDVSNSSILTLSNNTPNFGIVPTTTTCGSVCTTTIGTNFVKIEITTAEGIVTQQVGINGVTQNVQVAGNGNSISSAMQMEAQLPSFNGFNPGNLLPVLHTIDWMH